MMFLRGFVKRHSSSSASLLKTCLYDFHVKKGGKMVDFAGYSMPVQYADMGIVDSHKHTRSACSIFDVSHMQQSIVEGKDRIKFIESLTVMDAESLKENNGSLTVFTNEKGGIIDDLIVVKTSQDYLFLVTNAGCKDKDIPLMKDKVDEMQKDGLDVNLDLTQDRGLIAVQGPLMMSILQPHTNINLETLPFMTSQIGSVCGVENCRVTRCGYTGEDGVEISIPESFVENVVENLLLNSSVKMAGLGARDSLRLEAGLCLYGADINEDKSPIEAGLNWVIGKERRKRRDFPGAANIMEQINKKNTKVKRIGLISLSGPPARSGTKILNEKEEPVGFITSGCPSPTLKKNIAMGYVKKSYSKAGTHLKLKVRNSMVDSVVTKMPFVNCNYYVIK